MKTSALLRPATVRVNRSALRNRQSAVLKRVKGKTVLVITSRRGAEEKYVLDKAYFHEVLEKLGAAMETLEITADTKLCARLLRTAKTLEEDVRLQRLHRFEEAFGDR